jgi:alpha-glucosidase
MQNESANHMNNKIFLFTALVFCTGLLYGQPSKTYTLFSPGKKIKITVQTGPSTSWSVQHEATTVILPSPLSMTLSTGEVLGRNTSVKNTRTTSVHTSFATPVYKKSAVADDYQEMRINFRKDYGIIFRAYDEGVAYRFFTDRKDSIRIISEEARFHFEKDLGGYFSFARDPRLKGDNFQTSFEALYDETPISGIPHDTMAFLPVLLTLDQGKKAVITESGLENYPGMYLKAGTDNDLLGVFANYPVEEMPGGYNRINSVVTKRASYIASVEGRQFFPWRAIVISSSDKELANNDLVYKLASPSRIGDLSWIRPGKVAWDWWNDWNISGVDFKAGINTRTYQYYIDFAAAHQLEYIIIDEGWSDDADLMKVNPNVDLKEIVAYGKRKGVGVILWATWQTVNKQINEVFLFYADMGVKGFKIDFLDRDDQEMVASTYAIAKKAADHHLVVDYHGMFKPAGLQRTWPNVLNFEGVKGMENVKWTPNDDVPRYDVSIPFIRMLAGPMDYTPGAMRNANKWSFRPINSNPMSQGTRCHQLAMYVVFEAPLQMLADNPTAYQKEEECTRFISAIPAVFDETVALDGAVGNFVVLAKRKGGTWYVGALTNWDARELKIGLSFLGSGQYEAEVFRDGVNADRNATDYKKEILPVSATDSLNLRLASGGGWAAIIKKKN